MNKLRKIILAGLLLASYIVINRFLSINTPIVQIGFTFIASILSAMLLGIGWAVLINGLGDLLGALMFPFGAFFPGYTFTAILTGLIYGLFLNKAYKKSGKSFLWRLAVACLLVSVFCNLGLNTLWVWITTKKAIVVLLPTRLIKEAILLPIRIVVMEALHFAFIKSGVYKRLFKTEIGEEKNEGETEDTISNLEQNNTKVETENNVDKIKENKIDEAKND